MLEYLIPAVLQALALLNPSAEILFAGDAMQHQVQLQAAKTATGVYDYSRCYEDIDSIIKAADYAVVNLETPVGHKRLSGYPCFGAPVSYAVALKDAGFDMMLTANNHTLDRGDDGLRRTIAVLDSLNIDHLGTYRNVADRDTLLPKIVDIKGFKVGFLNYTYDTNGIHPTGDVAVDLINRDRIAKDIAATRNAGAEILCVAMHWGDEYLLTPPERIKKLAQFLKDQGVDIIFGGHPHVIQPMEIEVNPVTGRNTALFYSLGNFISGMRTRDTRGGVIAKVTLKRDSTGTAYVDRLANKLIFTLTPTTGGNGAFKVVPADSAYNTNANCKAFTDAALNIFRRYNVNISQW